MKLLFFCPRWGSEIIPWHIFLRQVKEAGYDGVEIGLPENKDEASAILELIRKEGLRFILQHYETSAQDFKAHRNIYRKHLARLAQQQPYLINSHTGRDIFDYDQNMLLLEDAKKIEECSGVTIAHETHRSRFCFAAHVTNMYLNTDWLNFTWDVSHWFCVAESLLEDQEPVIERIVPHVQHLHARFGHTQGSQIDDFHSDRWDATKSRHLQLWDKVINLWHRSSRKEFGITTEFGPWPYMLESKSGLQAQCRQFEMNKDMMSLLKLRYLDMPTRQPEDYKKAVEIYKDTGVD